jgi:outer membrane cobalamin receptor
MWRLIFLCVTLSTGVFAQNELRVKVLEFGSNEPIVNARVEIQDGRKFLTGVEGDLVLQEVKLPLKLSVHAIGFISDSLEVKKFGVVEIRLKSSEKMLQTVIVSAARREQRLEEVPVSMEVLSTAIMQNKGYTNLQEMVDQSPGVYAMDGQVSIRGGGGYAYGAGSRVLLLWNGIPMMSPDIGDAKWNAIPVEQSTQIEIMKGASSVLYGSGALNGTIALVEREPSSKGDISAKFQTGVYDNPRRSSLRWWSKNPMFYLADVYYGKSFKRLGFTLGVNGMWNPGYKKEEKENRARINGSLYYRLGKEMRSKLGVSYNFQYEDVGVFVLWKSAEEAMVAMDNTISNQRSIRLNVDPYLLMFDKKNNRHNFRTRYYLVSTGNIGNLYSTSKAEMYYADYQFYKKWKRNGAVTAGLTNNNNVVTSGVFGNHFSHNMGLYTQIDADWKKFDFTAGARLEYMRQDNMPLDSRFAIGNWESPLYPIFRGAMHYELFPTSHLRISAGQGIRFPSVAERFVSTSVGGLIIFNNPELRPEKGWSGELGWKQIIPVGKWKASVDVAGFINQYSNMTEFTFGLYIPDTITPSINPNELGYIGNWLGFQAQNAEEARITGVELSINSAGKIKEVEIISLLGYTYMNPVSLNTDSAYRETFSNQQTNLLKYRFRHLVKADVQVKWRKYAIGVSGRYNSYMENIDRIFEETLFGQELLPGLKGYREINNKGILVMDMRLIVDVWKDFSVNFIVNNLFNVEYVSRPADIQPPRTFMIQLRYGIQ